MKQDALACGRPNLSMSLRAKIEAVVYAAEEPVTLQQLVALFGAELQVETRTEQQQELDLAAQTEAETAAPEPVSDTASGNGTLAEPPEADAKRQARLQERGLREAMRRLLDALIAEYQASDRGMEIREIAGGYRMATKPEYHDAVRSFVRSLKPPMKLTLQALETLAVVAYKQPVTAPEISEIRGVESAGVLGSLMGRKLITTAGRKHVIGRPILYKTTKDFLLRFGLKDINELPSIEEFEKMAGELAEGDAEFEAAQPAGAAENESPHEASASQAASVGTAPGDSSTAEGA